jgi:oligopeptidase A
MEHPFTQPNFNPKWSSFEPSKIEADIDYAIELAEARLKAIEAIEASSANYQTVAKALETSTRELDDAWSIVDHLANTMDSPELREAYNKALPKVTEFYGGIILRPKLWEVVKSMAENEKEGHTLDAVEQRHLSEIVKDFTESGADLPEAQKQRIREIDSELAMLTQKYSENVLDSTNDWEILIEDPKTVEPIPEVIREIARENALSKGKGTPESPVWRFTLHAPSIMPFMKYIEDADLRKKAWQASSEIGNRGEWRNAPLVLKILQLREEKASILGEANFSDYVTKRRMAKAGKTARSFVQKLKNCVAPSQREEISSIERFRAESMGLESPEKVDPWDVAYWSEKLLKELHDFDDEQLRPYFSIGEVIEGMFGLAQKIFGLRFETRATHVGQDSADPSSIEVWTEKVQYYDVYDADSGVQLGGFYTDWFPRESKRSGAWMDSFKSGVFDKSGKPIEMSLGVLCGNMTPAKAGEPALITHDEVETVFHEFGHLLHHLCGEVTVKSLNGISVAWDFVEVPSQMMENWCWQRESLDLFARHYESGEVIPEELFQKMLSSRNFLVGLATMRQLTFGIMDLDLHLDFCEKHSEADEQTLEAFIENSISEYVPEWSQPAPPIYRRFGHLFGSPTGYASGYYSYKWSEVLEADAFATFQEEGILNPETGKRFRKSILAAGNSVEPMVAYERFKGRKPTFEAYLKRSGIALNELAQEAFGS